MRGRPNKPLGRKIAEGSRIRNDRINRDAPVPPGGEIVLPWKLSRVGLALWKSTLARIAPGQIKPLDAPVLWRYCWIHSRLLMAKVEQDAWSAKPDKKPGETANLRLAENGVLGKHPIEGVIDNLLTQIAKLESKLGLNPADREHIAAAAQQELPFANDPWASFDKPDEAVQ